jgi:hypothetical protein
LRSGTHGIRRSAVVVWANPPSNSRLPSVVTMARELTIYDSMVHYDTKPRSAAQRPSPLCPKCGSHRTEIIGQSKDQKITFLRCGACGAHSEVPVHDAMPLAPAS